MKILLINPPRVSGYPVVREERFEHKDIGSVYPPLSLLTTASILEQEGYAVEIIDANGFDLSLSTVKAEINRRKPNIIFARIGFDTQDEDLKVLKYAKEKGITTIIRNHIISRTPDLKRQLLVKNNFIDIFLNQEPEGIITPLIKALSKGDDLQKVKGISFRSGNIIQDNQDESLIRNLDTIPFPAYHLLPSLKVYYSGTFGPPFVTILGSRGCPFDCAFCAYGHQIYRTRGAKSIANEIEWFSLNFNVHEFCFLDDVVNIEPARMIDISKAIIRKHLKLRWSVGIRATSVTESMLKWMKKAGCDEIAVGVESGSDKMLINIGKQVKLDDIRKAARLCHKVGIKFYAMFIIGLPGENRESVMASIRFAKELKPFYTQFCFATPFPDTRIYSDYKNKGLLLTENWSKYFPLNREPVCRTEELSKRDLIILKDKAYRKTLFDPLYLLNQVRLNDWKWNIRGLKEVGKRMLSALHFQPVR